MTRKASWTGVLTSSDINQYLQDQAVQTYASEAARNAALTSPYTGQVVITTDTMTVWIYNGSAWIEYGTTGAWKSWTPTLTNITLGNGSMSGKYFKIGRTVHWKFNLVFGSTSSMGTNPVFTLPFTPVDYFEIDSTMGLAYDASAATRHVVFSAAGGGVVPLWIKVDGVAAVVGGNFTNTSPIGGWTTSDVLRYWGTYEAAA